MLIILGIIPSYDRLLTYIWFLLILIWIFFSLIDRFKIRITTNFWYIFKFFYLFIDDFLLFTLWLILLLSFLIFFDNLCSLILLNRFIIINHLVCGHLILRSDNSNVFDLNGLCFSNFTGSCLLIVSAFLLVSPFKLPLNLLIMLTFFKYVLRCHPFFKRMLSTNFAFGRKCVAIYEAWHI